MVLDDVRSESEGGGGGGGEGGAWADRTPLSSQLGSSFFSATDCLAFPALPIQTYGSHNMGTMLSQCC